MADTSQVEVPPHTNGISEDVDDDERAKMRPADIDADVKEMERRKRVELIMNSKLFRDELERIIEVQLRDGSGTSGLMQQISDMMGVSKNAGNVFKNSNCVVPINDIRGIEAMGYAKGEKILRCKLAAVYRLIDLYGWTQGTSTLITARLNQDEEHFLVNPYGMLFHEITASSLIKADMQGNVVEQGTTNFGVNLSAYSLHAAIHSSRPDIKCIIHVHTPSVVAISALKCGLLPISQESVVIGEVSTHSCIGGFSDPDEKDKITRNLGPNNKVLLLTNQGAVCCGETIEEAFFNARNTVLASESQLKLMPMGVDNLILLTDEQRKKLYDSAHKAPESSPRPDQPSILETKIERKWRVGGVEFEALMRMLDNAGFRTGYIYRHPLVKGDPPRPRSDVEVPPAVSSLGYLLEEEELYKQGLWKKLEGGRKGNDRTRWLNSPNVYQKVEILETGTPDPKKITKWVADGSPTHSSTPVKIESALQFVPKNTNPKEFKKLQQQIKDYRRADKISAGPQSHILEGVTWEEAKKMQDAGVTQTGDQVVLMGAASKGIIQRGFQHNATMYKSPYAKNPFDCITDEEIDEYKKVVEKKTKGEYDTDFSESEGLSSAQINKRISDIRSPTSAASETEEESRDEPQVLRIETKQAPKPSQPEVVLSDDIASRNLLIAERNSATNSMRSGSIIKLVTCTTTKSSYYRTNSFSGFPSGSYAVPNPKHYHIARYTRATEHRRPTLIRLKGDGPSNPTNTQNPNIVIQANGRSIHVDMSLQTLVNFVEPLSRSLSMFVCKDAAAQTCYNGEFTAVTPLVEKSVDTEMGSLERSIMNKLHANLMDDLNNSNRDYEMEMSSLGKSTTASSVDYHSFPELYNFSIETSCVSAKDREDKSESEDSVIVRKHENHLRELVSRGKTTAYMSLDFNSEDENELEQISSSTKLNVDSQTEGIAAEPSIIDDEQKTNQNEDYVAEEKAIIDNEDELPLTEGTNLNNDGQDDEYNDNAAIEETKTNTDQQNYEAAAELQIIIEDRTDVAVVEQIIDDDQTNNLQFVDTVVKEDFIDIDKQNVDALTEGTHLPHDEDENDTSLSAQAEERNKAETINIDPNEVKIIFAYIHNEDENYPEEKTVNSKQDQIIIADDQNKNRNEASVEVVGKLNKAEVEGERLDCAERNDGKSIDNAEEISGEQNKVQNFEAAGTIIINENTLAEETKQNENTAGEEPIVNTDEQNTNRKEIAGIQENDEHKPSSITSEVDDESTEEFLMSNIKSLSHEDYYSFDNTGNFNDDQNVLSESLELNEIVLIIKDSNDNVDATEEKQDTKTEDTNLGVAERKEVLQEEEVSMKEEIVGEINDLNPESNIFEENISEINDANTDLNVIESDMLEGDICSSQIDTNVGLGEGKTFKGNSTAKYDSGTKYSEEIMVESPNDEKPTIHEDTDNSKSTLTILTNQNEEKNITENVSTEVKSDVMKVNDNNGEKKSKKKRKNRISKNNENSQKSPQECNPPKVLEVNNKQELPKTSNKKGKNKEKKILDNGKGVDKQETAIEKNNCDPTKGNDEDSDPLKKTKNDNVECSIEPENTETSNITTNTVEAEHLKKSNENEICDSTKGNDEVKNTDSEHLKKSENKVECSAQPKNTQTSNDDDFSSNTAEAESSTKFIENNNTDSTKGNAEVKRTKNKSNSKNNVEQLQKLNDAHLTKTAQAENSKANENDNSDSTNGNDVVKRTKNKSTSKNNVESSRELQNTKASNDVKLTTNIAEVENSKKSRKKNKKKNAATNEGDSKNTTQNTNEKDTQIKIDADTVSNKPGSGDSFKENKDGENVNKSDSAKNDKKSVEKETNTSYLKPNLNGKKNKSGRKKQKQQTNLKAAEENMKVAEDKEVNVCNLEERKKAAIKDEDQKLDGNENHLGANISGSNNMAKDVNECKSGLLSEDPSYVTVDESFPSLSDQPKQIVVKSNTEVNTSKDLVDERHVEEDIHNSEGDSEEKQDPSLTILNKRKCDLAEERKSKCLKVEQTQRNKKKSQKNRNAKNKFKQPLEIKSSNEDEFRVIVENVFEPVANLQQSAFKSVVFDAPMDTSELPEEEYVIYQNEEQFRMENAQIEEKSRGFEEHPEDKDDEQKLHYEKEIVIDETSFENVDSELCNEENNGKRDEETVCDKGICERVKIADEHTENSDSNRGDFEKYLVENSEKQQEKENIAADKEIAELLGEIETVQCDTECLVDKVVECDTDKVEINQKEIEGLQPLKQQNNLGNDDENAKDNQQEKYEVIETNQATNYELYNLEERKVETTYDNDESCMLEPNNTETTDDKSCNLEQEMADLITNYLCKSCLQTNDNSCIFPELAEDENFEILTKKLLHIYQEYFLNSYTTDTLKSELRLRLQEKVLHSLDVDLEQDSITDRSFVITELLCLILDYLFEHFEENEDDDFGSFQGELDVDGRNHSTPVSEKNGFCDRSGRTESPDFDSQEEMDDNEDQHDCDVNADESCELNTEDCINLRDCIATEVKSVLKAEEAATITAEGNEAAMENEGEGKCETESVSLIKETLKAEGDKTESVSVIKDTLKAEGDKTEDFTPNDPSDMNKSGSHDVSSLKKRYEALTSPKCSNIPRRINKHNKNDERNTADQTFSKRPDILPDIMEQADSLECASGVLETNENAENPVKKRARAAKTHFELKIYKEMAPTKQSLSRIDTRKAKPKTVSEDKFPHCHTRLSTNSSEPIEEDVTSFRVKRLSSGNEFFWVSIPKSSPRALLTPPTKSIFINVDDIPLRPPADLNATVTVDRSLSPIMEEANRTLCFDDCCNVRLKTESSTSRRCLTFQTQMACTSSNDNPECLNSDECAERKALPNRNAKFVNIEYPEVNRVVSNEVHFFRSTTVTSSSYVQAENITFNKNKKDDDGDWMGYENAKF